MRIALCDDQACDLRNLRNLLDEYLAKTGIVAQVREFAHPDALLDDIDHVRYSLYILDVVMPMVGGIEVGRIIRRCDRRAQILFVTNDAGFALESFDASPVNYLLKPIDRARFFSSLDLAFYKVNPVKEDIVTVKTADGLRSLPFSDIVFCEYHRHTVRYELVFGECVLSRHIPENFQLHTAALLKDGMFVKAHEAFVLNIAHIVRLARTEAVMKGNRVVPVSRSQYAAVRDAYLSFRLG